MLCSRRSPFTTIVERTLEDFVLAFDTFIRAAVLKGWREGMGREKDNRLRALGDLLSHAEEAASGKQGGQADSQARKLARTTSQLRGWAYRYFFRFWQFSAQNVGGRLKDLGESGLYQYRHARHTAPPRRQGFRSLLEFVRREASVVITLLGSRLKQSRTILQNMFQCPLWKSATRKGRDGPSLWPPPPAAT